MLNWHVEEGCRQPCTEWQDPSFHDCVPACVKGKSFPGGFCYNDGTYKFGLDGTIVEEEEGDDGGNDDPTDPTAGDV